MNMSDLDRILAKYASFEKTVYKQISRVLGEYCTDCEGGCCTAAICRETKESPFLILLCNVFQPSVRYQKRKGWQRKTGCVLQVGRPPICYEFICSEIERSQTAPLERYVVKVLCRLVTHTGKRANGSVHLVEVTDKRDLHEIPLKRFEVRLREAEAAFNAIKSFFVTKGIEAEDLPVLGRICPLPPSLRRNNKEGVASG